MASALHSRSCRTPTFCAGAKMKVAGRDATAAAVRRCDTAARGAHRSAAAPVAEVADRARGTCRQTHRVLQRGQSAAPLRPWRQQAARQRSRKLQLRRAHLRAPPALLASTDATALVGTAVASAVLAALGRLAAPQWVSTALVTADSQIGPAMPRPRPAWRPARVKHPRSPQKPPPAPAPAPRCAGPRQGRRRLQRRGEGALSSAWLAAPSSAGRSGRGGRLRQQRGRRPQQRRPAAQPAPLRGSAPGAAAASGGSSQPKGRGLAGGRRQGQPAAAAAATLGRGGAPRAWRGGQGSLCRAHPRARSAKKGAWRGRRLPQRAPASSARARAPHQYLLCSAGSPKKTVMCAGCAPFCTPSTRYMTALPSTCRAPS